MGLFVKELCAQRSTLPLSDEMQTEVNRTEKFCQRPSLRCPYYPLPNSYTMNSLTKYTFVNDFDQPAQPFSNHFGNCSTDQSHQTQFGSGGATVRFCYVLIFVHLLTSLYLRATMAQQLLWPLSRGVGLQRCNMTLKTLWQLRPTSTFLGLGTKHTVACMSPILDSKIVMEFKSEFFTFH